jgi:hypothetical protein
VTLGELVRRASLTVGIAADDAQHTDDRDLLRLLANEAVLDILSRTRVNVRAADLELADGEREYTIAGDVLQIYGLDREGRRLGEIASADMTAVEEGTFSVIGFNRIRLGWTPSADNTLTAWYAPRPTAMTDDAHDPSAETYGGIPVQFHGAIVNYMAWKASDVSKDDGSQRGEKYRVFYEGPDGLGLMGTDIGRIRHATNRRMAGGRRTARPGPFAGLPSSHWRG